MINLGILGCGRIAKSLAKAAQNCSEEVNLYACAAREKSRAEEFSREFGIEVAYGSYEEMLRDEKVDLVYVATPIAMHYDNVLQCLNANKNVLCEKCFTINSEQAEQLFSLATSRGLFLMEAVWTRFIPFVNRLDELISGGEIGEVTRVKANFCMKKPRGTRNYRYELGGGALLDMGMYAVTIADMAIKKDVKEISTTAKMENNVDIDDTIDISYEGGAKAELKTSLIKTRSLAAVIEGTEGKITLPFYWFAQTICVKKKGKRGYRIDCSFSPSREVYNGYRYELIEAADCIEKGKLQSDIMPHATTLRIIGQLDRIRSIWGMKYTCEK